jgi:hypothetical protein
LRYFTDFSQFQKVAIDKLKAGQSLAGKDGILPPLIKEILEAAKMKWILT